MRARVTAPLTIGRNPAFYEYQIAADGLFEYCTFGVPGVKPPKWCLKRDAFVRFKRYPIPPPDI